MKYANAAVELSCVLSDDLATLRAHAWRQVPPIIYHYTSLEAFVGILSSGRLWATNASCLPDPAELQYTIDLVTETFQKLRRRSKSRLAKDLIATALRYLSSRWGAADVYVVCFSELSDAKTIWTGFETSGGIAIGVATEPLANAWGNKHTLLTRVIYDRSMQERLVQAIAERSIAALDGQENLLAEYEGLFSAIASTISSEVLQHAIQFKSPHFADEREWRAVYQVRAYPGFVDGLLVVSGDYGLTFELHG